MIKLSQLIAPWAQIVLETDILVSNLELDSRQVKLGDTFVAVKGHEVDGRLFIESAISKGANLVLADADTQHLHASVEQRNNCLIVYLEHLSSKLSQIASKLYSYQEMKLIGVTGTNGKTTITQIIAQWLGLLDTKAAVMGTAGNGFLSNLQVAKNTTGSAIDILKKLANLNENGAKVTALEVSSHGLVQNRVKALNFDVAIFTNLSRDHLDYHQTMAEYANAKLSLFTKHKCLHQVINIDDEIGQLWSKDLKHAICISLYPIEKEHETQQCLFATSVEFTPQGIVMTLDGTWGKTQLMTPLIGEFNALNLLSAMAALLALGYPLADLVKTSANLLPVIGRMELFSAPHGAKSPQIVVDYAHTPDALEKALKALRIHTQGELWCLFGCGGDRDTGKRPMMMKAAQQYADKIIITDDNPRTESAEQIVDDILQGATCPEQVKVIHDRFNACQYALTQAKSGDIILMAGKGHEDYQIIGTHQRHYSDRETAQNLLGYTV